MPGRKYNSGNYRNGFNGKENDREWGDQLIQDYGFRLYNPAIGKFLSVDPLGKDYPWNSAYAFAENDVIRSIDLEGAERLIRINYYDANGNIGRTKLLTLTDNQTGNLVNFQAQLNGVPITGNPEILEINKPDPNIAGGTLRNARTGVTAPANQQFGTAGTGNAPLSNTTTTDNQILARTVSRSQTIDNNPQQGNQGSTSVPRMSQITQGGNVYTFPGSDILDVSNGGLATDTYTATAQELPAPILALFQGNSAQFTNTIQATNSIQGLVSFLNDNLNAGSTIQLTGNAGTAGVIAGQVYGTGAAVWAQPIGRWVDENNVARASGRIGQLMQARSNAVQNLLIDAAGIRPPNQRVGPPRITGSNPGSRQPNVANRNVGVTVN